MRKLSTYLTLAAIFVVSFAGAAFAAGAATPDGGSPLDYLKPLLDAATGHQWWLFAAMALVAGATAFKKYAPAGALRDFANSDAGGAALVLAGSFGGALVASLTGASPVPMSADLAWSAIKVAVGAAGGYALIKKLLIDPMLASAWYKSKAPAWLKAVLSLATWAFTKPGDAAIADAEKAGSDAVKANPGGGADAVVGKPPEKL